MSKTSFVSPSPRGPSANAGASASFFPRGLKSIVPIVLCFCFTVFGGCEPATEWLQPPPGEEDDEEEGTVERATIAITVITDGESAEAAALGSAPGRLRGAEVRIRRFGESEVRSSVTYSVGQVGFEDLLPGNYEVSVLRPLTDADREKLAELDGDLAKLSAFVGGFASVSASADSFDVEVTAGRRRSLMVSEVYNQVPRTTSNVFNTPTARSSTTTPTPPFTWEEQYAHSDFGSPLTGPTAPAASLLLSSYCGIGST